VVNQSIKRFLGLGLGATKVAGLAHPQAPGEILGIQGNGGGAELGRDLGDPGGKSVQGLGVHLEAEHGAAHANSDARGGEAAPEGSEDDVAVADGVGKEVLEEVIRELVIVLRLDELAFARNIEDILAILIGVGGVEKAGLGIEGRLGEEVLTQ